MTERDGIQHLIDCTARQQVGETANLYAVDGGTSTMSAGETQADRDWLVQKQLSQESLPEPEKEYVPCDGPDPGLFP